MIILVSPTKQMTPSLPEGVDISLTDPQFKSHAHLINGALSGYTLESLQGLMKISPDLAINVNERVKNFGKTDSRIYPALFSYTGTVFKEMNPHTFTQGDLDFAHEHLRILSGYYGLLKPLDGIKPYRLEMKTPLPVEGAKNLYSYWNPRVNQGLQEELSRDQPILNLASREYFKMIEGEKLSARIITVGFKEPGSKGPRVVGTYAKVARGRLVRRIIQEHIKDPEIIKSWNVDGYKMNDDLSSGDDWIFYRS